MKNYLPEGCAAPHNTYYSLPALNDAMMRRNVLEARAVMCDQQHNLIVDLGGVKGIIPRVEGAVGIEDGSVRDIAIITRVGKPVCFTVTEITADGDGRPVAILSRRDAQVRAAEEYVSTLAAGDVVDAVVTHLEPFGAFCDIGCGIASLLPIDSISVSRISHPHDRFTPGDRIKAVVKSNEDGRVTLSMKELLGTWEQNAGLFAQGETVSGIIRSVEDYGIFVELMPNLAGLAEPKDNVEPSMRASVYIKSIIPDKMKIKLIIIDAFESNMRQDSIRYFDQSSHIDSWNYSPFPAQKLITTVF